MLTETLVGSHLVLRVRAGAASIACSARARRVQPSRKSALLGVAPLNVQPISDLERRSDAFHRPVARALVLDSPTNADGCIE